MTNQTIERIFAPIVPPLDARVRRLLDSYPAIFLACHIQHVRDTESGRGITDNQASILDHLDATRPTRLTELAEHMGVSRSTMSITVKKLIRAGYVARKRSLKDGRGVALTLTRAGERITEQNTVLDPELVKALFRLLPAAEVENSLRGIERLAAAARAILRRRSRQGGSY